MPNVFTTDIIIEKGAPYVIFHTNITVRPVKLLIDTGTMDTIIASKLIKPNVSVKVDHILSIHGVAGLNVGIQTHGYAKGAILSSDDNKIAVKLNLLDKKYVIKGDGYLGFDFLYKYQAKIDIFTKKLIYQRNK